MPNFMFLWLPWQPSKFSFLIAIFFVYSMNEENEPNLSKIYFFLCSADFDPLVNRLFNGQSILLNDVVYKKNNCKNIL